MKYLMLCCLFLVQVALFSQTPDYPYPPLSPKGQIIQKVGNTLIEISYERPSVRGRKIFGELVPWNKIWRTGAGYCTKIKFDNPVKIGNQQIMAGHYSLHTIPNPNQWLVILNTDTTLYGSYHHESKKDVARFVVTPKKSSRFYEALTIDIDIIPNNAQLYISWANVQIDFPIETTTDAEILPSIKALLVNNSEKNPDVYAGAADYLLFQGVNLLDALKLADKAIALDKDSWANRLKVDLYEKLQLYEEALQALQKCINYTKKAKFEKEEWRTDELEGLKIYEQRIKNKLQGRF